MVVQCWVPHCNASKALEPNRNFFPLPRDVKFKETWLALTGKKVILEEDVYYCESHFRESALDVVMGKVIGLTSVALPFHKMPQMICRTCMCTIAHNAYFCVVSATVPSAVPPELHNNLVQCRPEPLYQMLTFCIPKLIIEQNPPSLVCISCYEFIWRYFSFKITCNSIQSRIRGNLSLEEYGKLVLCRACPVTSGTRFFFLSENVAMGQILKDMFLRKYPSHTVPLKLCLKCWNQLHKITQFHQRCVSLDQMLKRCADLNQGQPYGEDGIPRQSGLLQGPQNLMEPIPSTSKGSSDAHVPYMFEDVSKVKSPEIVPKQCREMQYPSVIDLEVDPEMPTLTPNVDNLETDSKMPQLTLQVETEPDEKEKSFTAKDCSSHLGKVLLVNLILKYTNQLKPSLDPIERARADLDLWCGVVKELHGWGFIFTLSSAQDMWEKMKIDATLATRQIGPMTYLDYLVDRFVTSAKDGTTCTLESGVSDASEDVNAAGTISDTSRRKTLPGGADISLAVADTEEVILIADDCEVICIDDDSDVEVCPNGLKTDVKTNSGGKTVKKVRATTVPIGKLEKNPVKKKVRAKTVPIDGDVNSRGDHSVGVIKEKLKELRTFRMKRPATPPTRKQTGNPDAPLRKKRGRGKRKWRKVDDVWGQKEKLELVLEMRKLLNGAIERQQVNKYKNPPWRDILHDLVMKGFRGYEFGRLYNEWNKVKRSATIYEKNGQDVVDNEVWDLLQFYKDHQSNASKRKDQGSGGADDGGKREKSEIPGTSKRPKLLPSEEKDQGACTFVGVHASGEQINTSNLQNDTTASKKFPASLSTDETLEVLKLIKKEFNKIFVERGVIDETLTEILERIKYKDYPPAVMVHHWQKLAIAASEGQSTVVHRKVLLLLKTYRENRLSKKVNVFPEGGNQTASGPTRDNSDPKRGRPSKLSDEEKVEFITIVRSFGNKVFKEKKMASSERKAFWAEVAGKLLAMGCAIKRSALAYMWSVMLRSAKVAWAQEDRKASASDQMIIDFMMEVIREKETTKQESAASDLSAGDDALEESKCEKETNDSEEDLHESDASDCARIADDREETEQAAMEIGTVAEKVEGVENATKEYDSDDVIFNEYDYVSLEDIQREYGTNIIENSTHVAANEVGE